MEKAKTKKTCSNRRNNQSLLSFEKETEALIKCMKIENTVYTSAEVNCWLKFMNNENMGEVSFDNLEDVNLFLTQT